MRSDRLKKASTMFFTQVCCGLAAAGMLLLCGASHADPNAAASPPAPFVITLHVANAPGKDYFDLDNPNSSFDITVKNVSSVPRSVGFLDCALRITAINGHNLSIPHIISPTGMWAAYALQRIQPGEQTVVHFLVSYLPKFYQVIPNNVYQMLYQQGRTSTLLHNDDRLVSGPFLPRLAGSHSSRFEIITASAVCPKFVSDKRFTQSISAPVTFKTGL